MILHSAVVYNQWTWSHGPFANTELFRLFFVVVCGAMHAQPNNKSLNSMGKKNTTELNEMMQRKKKML